MLPQNIKYTEKVLHTLLESYKEYYLNPYPHAEVTEEVGKNIINGKVFKEKTYV